MLGKKEKTPLGIYIHVPFCRSKCQYCDFYSLGGAREKGLTENYLEAVIRHMQEAGALAPGYRVDTVYFGGGTPSYLGQDGLIRLMDGVRRRFSVAGDAEVTLEANPDSVSEKMLKRLKAEGFNRLSLGVQTDDDLLLRKLGRPHSYRQAAHAVELARQAGFTNISLDLMYGLPGQTRSDWVNTLTHVLELQPEHMSCYGLKVEEGTPLWSYRQAANLPDDDTQADMYLEAVNILKDRGYAQYEISNFARPGEYALHNTAYWQGIPYLGLGPSAHSYDGVCRRSNPSDLRHYIASVEQGKTIFDTEFLDADTRYNDRVITSLRTMWGLDLDAVAADFGEERRRYCMRMARRYIENGLLDVSGGRLKLTRRGVFVSDGVMADLLFVGDE